MTQRGKPGGCATPSPRAATINSPLSTSVTVGASVNVYSSSATTNTAPAQSSSDRGQKFLPGLAFWTDFDALFSTTFFAIVPCSPVPESCGYRVGKLAFLQTVKAIRGRIALRKHFVQKPGTSFCFAQALEVRRVLASFFAATNNLVWLVCFILNKST